MSFSQEVREELIKHYDRQVHCQKAELAAIMMFGSRGLQYDRESDKYVYTDPRTPVRNDFTENRKTFNIKGEMDMSKGISALTGKPDDRRAFLRGAFIAAGTVSDPERDYHFEIAAPDEYCADILTGLLEDLDIRARRFRRRDGKTVVYVKEHDGVSLLLNAVGAHVAMMNFENIRIERELKGAVNRRLNCDTANINKAVSASMKQIADIELIRDTVGFDRLDDGLRAICEVRLANPDATLSEIAEMMVPAIGKSGANHRFRKLSKMADDIRAKHQ